MGNGARGVLTSAMAFNAWEFAFYRIFSPLQRRNPFADCYAQGLQHKPSMNVWKSIDLCKPGLKKIPSPLSILSRIVVECRRDLDQTLQEHFFRIEGLEPDFLPMFMGVKEVP
jgi:hypothetical protein